MIKPSSALLGFKDIGGVMNDLDKKTIDKIFQIVVDEILKTKLEDFINGDTDSDMLKWYNQGKYTGRLQAYNDILGKLNELI